MKGWQMTCSMDQLEFTSILPLMDLAVNERVCRMQELL